MYCKNCGTMIAEGAAFCSNCGTPVETKADPAPAYSEVTTPAGSYTYAPAPTVDGGSILTFGILALAFACTFFASFLGIVFGAVCKGKVNAYCAAGAPLEGKAKVGSILGKVGLILGIVMTAIFVVYIFVIVIAALSFSYY